MSTPARAAAASERLSAARPPIRQGAAFDRPTRRTAPIVEQEAYDERDYEPEPAQPRRRQAEYAPEPRRPDSGGVLWGITFLAIGVAMGYLLITRGYIPIPMPETAQQAMPTAGIIVVTDPPPSSDYGIPAYNATQEAAAAAQDRPTATQEAPTSVSAAAPQEAAGEGGEAIEAGRVAAPVAPIIRATQTAAPVLSVESERGGEAIEAGRVAMPVVRIAAPTVVAEGGTAAGAGSFVRKVGKP